MVATKSIYSEGTIHETPKGTVRILKRKPGSKKPVLVHPRLVIEILATGTVLDVQQGNLKAGKFTDYMERSVYGVGYLGSNISIPNRKYNTIIRRVYDLWANMLKRAYGGYKTCYKGATVEKRWHNFTNFLNTIHLVDGYDRWEKGENMRLDKDIKSGGKCREYSVENCIFVTPTENVSEMLKRRWHGTNDSM